MKELQKYHACLDKSHLPDKYCERSCPDSYKMIYLASEADAAFAEMRREHVQALIEQRDTESGRLHKIFDAEIERLKQHHAEEIERLKAEHEKTLRRQASAALSGMDAAKKISSYQLERAAKLHSESKPEAIDSERRANAILTEENERLRKQAERYEKLKGIGSRSLERLLWQSLDDPTSFDALVDQLPASGEASADEQASRIE